MANVSKPNTFTANTTISSSQVNDNFDTIYNEFNGNISGANLAAGAVTSSKIASSVSLTDVEITGGLTANNNIDLVDGKAIRDGNDNELIKVSQTTSAVNEVTVKNAATGNPPEIQATGDDTNIDLKLVPKGTGEVTKNGNPIDWWEEIGRTTLGSAGDTITVSSLPARKYLKVLISCRDTGGTINMKVTFNGDTSGNYAQRGLDNATETTFTSQTGITISAAAVAAPTKAIAEIENSATVAKLWNSVTVNRGTAGAGNLTSNRTVYAKWENTSNAISSITITNAGTGDFAIGSEIVVLGHD